MRIVIGEDSTLFRAGLRSLLTELGRVVAAGASDAPSTLAAVLEHRPDVANLDIRMPRTTPTTAPGWQRASAASSRVPESCSSPSRPSHACPSTSSPPATSATSSRTVSSTSPTSPPPSNGFATGGSALNPEVVARLMVGGGSALAPLTTREREVLALMAEGLTNSGVAQRLVLTDRTVETHVGRILHKLGLGETTTNEHRRVLAVLRYLEDHRAG